MGAPGRGSAKQRRVQQVLCRRCSELVLAYFMLGLICLSATAWAQQTSPGNSSQNSAGTAPPNLTITQSAVPESIGRETDHPVFWDRTNILLFAGVGLARGLDYSSTGNLRRRGRQEILLNNDIVDNKPLFATIEAAGTAASIGVSYLFHRTQHHRLERWTSIVHIGVGTFGAIHNYSLETFHHSGP